MNAPSCDGSGDAGVCAMLEPHHHCVCGLPAGPDSEYCELCMIEGLSPVEGRPSRRLNQCHSHPDALVALVQLWMEPINRRTTY